MGKIDQCEALKELRTRVERGKVSLLLGAGFSKNAWPKFPSWGELLSDMINYLYGDGPDVKDIVERKGYLKIVSEYIERKGIRESIEDYIEQRIPFMYGNKKLLRFVGKEPIELSDSDLELHKDLLTTKWEKIYTTNYDDLLEFVSEQNGLEWKAICSADKLSLNDRTTNLIIKLHGSIYHHGVEEFHSFEFDGNHHQRYIISEEDYKNYPKDHEAFTQLMRISLLQSTFCLIGFSGNDPNFLSWINWVRDILVHSSNEYNVKTAKVFLIDVMGNNPPSDIQLFYKNHHLVYISLRDPAVLDLINVGDLLKKKQNQDEINKCLMNSFLAYLKHDDLLSVKLNVPSRRVYSALWDKFLRLNCDENVSYVMDIKDRMEKNKVVTSVYSQQILLDRASKQKNLSSNELTMVLIALRDTGLPVSYYHGLKRLLEDSICTKWQNDKYLEIKIRDAVLTNEDFDEVLTTDFLVYAKILQSAFRLDFADLYRRLKAWNPKDFYKLIKAVWLSFFKGAIDINLLNEFRNETDDSQEEYWATEFIRIYTFSSNKKISVVKYINMGLLSMYDVRDLIINQCFQSKERIDPYGQSTNFVSFRKENVDYEHSMKVLQFFINFPCMPSIGIMTMVSADKWYKIFLSLYMQHPFPALFYSLTISDTKILKRIGQDYCYSDALFEKGVQVKMMKFLFSSVFEARTPEYLKKKELIILREFLYTIKISLWENDFMRIWKSLFVPIFDRGNESEELFEFIQRGVLLMDNLSNVEEIIKDCLLFSKRNRLVAIGVFFYLRLNERFKEREVSLDNEIFSFIEGLDDIDDVQILGNIHRILTQKHKKRLCEKILLMTNKEIELKNSMNALCALSRDNEELMISVKEAILRDDRLWQNGIHKDGTATPALFIQIIPFSDVLDWTEEELEYLYEKLRLSAHVLFESHLYKNYQYIDKMFFNHDRLLRDMYMFLKHYYKRLEHIDGFYDEYEQLEKELIKVRGFRNLEEGLLSEDEEIFAEAADVLIIELRKDKEALSEKDSSICMIADRILFNKKECLDLCLDYLSYILKTFLTKPFLTEMLEHKILLILERYDIKHLLYMESDLIKSLGHLVSLAQTMECLGVKSKAIDKWLELKKSGRYNLRSL